MSRPQPKFVPSAAQEPVQGQAASYVYQAVRDAIGDAAESRVFADIRALKSTTAKSPKLVKLLKQALLASQQERWKDAANAAMAAMALDENNVFAVHTLAIALEKAREFGLAIEMYERALKLAPNDAGILENLGLLSWRLGSPKLARTFLGKALAISPDNVKIACNYALSLRDNDLHEDAIEVLRGRIMEHPENPSLWSALGSVVLEQALYAEAIEFYNEALRLNPGHSRARHNLAHVLYERSDLETSLGYFEAAEAGHTTTFDRLETRHAKGLNLLALGRLEEGWEAYRARMDPQFSKPLIVRCGNARLWKGEPLEGQGLMLMGEQGLGDEVLYLNAADDAARAVGPEGKLALVVEKRLIPLVQRSFPDAWVLSHGTGKLPVGLGRVPQCPPEQLEPYRYYTLLGEAAAAFRPSVEAFPKRERFLVPDPERVTHWRAWLDSVKDGPAVGLTWKSLLMTGARRRYFSPFEQWEGTITTPGLTFINMQYGDCAAELAEAKARYGIDILQPPGINLKDDLDDLAALTTALDLMIGPMNATTNIAAACGGNVWLIGVTKRAWTMLGTDHMPWYPQARVFVPEEFADWTAVMGRVEAELAEFAKA